MREAVLLIKVPDSWMADIGTKYDRPIKFLDCMPYDGAGGKGLIEIGHIKEDVNELIEMIRRHPNVEKIELSPSPDGSTIASISCHDKCAACKSLMDSNCFLISASSGKNGFIEWRLLVGEGESLSELMDKLKEYGCNVELKKSTRITKKRLLTDRQDQIIRIAFDKGYYNIPKKTTIEELAMIINISKSTLAEILQRAEKKVIWQHFNKILACRFSAKLKLLGQWET